jgi:ubiquinone/menaquinone biosynthesis C-methylase UbiE
MQMLVDQTKLEEFAGQVVADAAAAASGALVVLADRLGLYKSIAEAGEVTSHELAHKTGLHERYLREWLCAQAASGYVAYDESNGTFSLTPEQYAVFVDESSPAFLTGVFQNISAVYCDEPTISKAFQSGQGVSWGDHSACLFCGTERFFGGQYRHFLIDHWLPALDGVVEKLEIGARVADVGCGHGVSTLLMAEAFPNSTFVGFDSHENSIRRGQKMADDHGLRNVRFETSDAAGIPGENYDLVAMFDCLHDLGDPVGAARRAHQCLASDGTFLVVEPLAGDRLEENFNPLGRIYYSVSTMVCVPASLSQKVGTALGAQAGEARLREVLTEAGFKRFSRVSETPTNMVLEVRA